MNQVLHIIEPKRLLLVWQASDGVGIRRIIGELCRINDEIEFKYFHGTSDFESAQKEGFAGFPAFKIKQQKHTNGILDTFTKRIPPRSRTDFEKYLRKLKISPKQEISDFALLGYSEAKLPGDRFSIVHPFDDCDPPFEFLTEIAGFRHHEGMQMDLEIGESIVLDPEADNEFDSNAIRVLARGEKIGYINRVQALTFHRWLDTGHVKAVIDRKNGDTERPQVYLFVEITKKSREG